jgi:hypothetical protein
VEVEDRIQKLAEIEEPLQKPFVEEALSKLLAKTDTATVTEQVLLKDGISKLRALNKEKEDTLQMLWKEWETVQFEIMSLAVERFGKESISITQLPDENITDEQKKRLADMVDAAQTACEETHRVHTEFRGELQNLEDSMVEISKKTKIAGDNIQRVRPISGPLYVSFLTRGTVLRQEEGQWTPPNSQYCPATPRRLRNTLSAGIQNCRDKRGPGSVHIEAMCPASPRWLRLFIATSETT